MQNELDAKFLFSVFSKIEKHGKAINNELGAGFELEGVTVNSGFDGYEVYFSNGKVQLTLGFHNKWHSDAKSETDMDEFMAQLRNINRQH
ncbi:DUF3081 family protein [Rheinheimera pacifica]|uniref:DUF3081 domain-containing protein n=1 Tax=Rheinheimera pacifica TaxID=173990 RepID=A0A1H6N847_9GAMM|nr:DUF3081 family protein [Rheinheimera pacifica]SEI10978.1 Protein of unknown function [Rheinheimera pacifica]